jgi:hypothetical protein
VPDQRRRNIRSQHLTRFAGGAPAYAGSSLILDPVHDRLVLFGGYRQNLECGHLPFFSYLQTGKVWTLPLADGGAWAEVPLPGGGPSPRANHTAVYDPERSRMIVFGGGTGYLNGTLFNETWALSLDGSPAWTALAPEGTPPPALAEHSAIYDPVRERVIVFGGKTGSSSSDLINSVWALSLYPSLRWDRLNAQGLPPSARSGHTAVYDPIRDAMIVFGGGGQTDQTFTLTWGDPLTLVPIEIRAGAPLADISARSEAHLRVVVFSTDKLDATTIDPITVDLNQVPVFMTGAQRQAMIQDVDKDGLRDLVLHFQAASFATAPEDLRLRLQGRTYAGRLVRGTDVLERTGKTVHTQELAASPMGLALAVRNNPVQGHIHLGVTLAGPGAAHLDLFDVMGRRVDTRDLGPAVDTSAGYQWDISGIPSGMYFVRLTQGPETVTRRFLLMK